MYIRVCVYFTLTLHSILYTNIIELNFKITLNIQCACSFSRNYRFETAK